MIQNLVARVNRPSRRRMLLTMGCAGITMTFGPPMAFGAQRFVELPGGLDRIRALVFDVFGTVVDWRGTLIRTGNLLNSHRGLDIDWAAFADAWRAEYRPSMEPIRNGEREWVDLDVLHWENLRKVTDKLNITGLTEADKQYLHLVWHRLDPWPDVVEGLTRLKRRFVTAALSNGNVAMMVDIARHGGIPWDTVLGAEMARQYKPVPSAYLTSVDMLGLTPEEVLMVAAHNGDLRGARRAGLRTALVIRPTMHGPDQTKDLSAEENWDVVATDFLDLASQLGV